MKNVKRNLKKIMFLFFVPFFILNTKLKIDKSQEVNKMCKNESFLTLDFNRFNTKQYVMKVAF